MDKRMLLAGIILIVASLAASTSISSGMFPSLPSGASGNDIAINSNSVVYSAIPVNEPGILSVSYASTNSLDFYLMSSAAFASLQPYFSSNSSIESAAKAYEGNGLIAMVLNSSAGLVPYQSGYSGVFPMPAYYSGTVASNGTYYAVFQNRNGFSEVFSFRSFLVPVSGSSTQLLGVSQVSLVLVAVLFLAGLALLVYSFIRPSGKGPEGADANAKAAEAYLSIDRRRSRGSRNARRRHSKRP